MNNLSQQNLWAKMNLALKQIKTVQKKEFVPKYIIRREFKNNIKQVG